MASTTIVLDTYANIDYFVKTFRIQKKKFVRVLIGADDTIMYPQESDQPHSKFLVEFHGNYIPVQGPQYIIEAANILRNEDIIFEMIGSGQEFKRVKELATKLNLTNVIFYPPVPFEDLPKFIARADVCLGLLGSVPRTDRAIPNKVYEAAAMKKPSINANTSAIRELFEDSRDVILCRGGDGQSLANAILSLKNDKELKIRIGENAYQLFKKTSTPELIVVPILELMKKLMK